MKKRNFFILSLLLIFSIQVSWAQITVNIDSTHNVKCAWGHDGEIFTSTSGGTASIIEWTGPYDYTNNTLNISNLEAGTYDLMVIDTTETPHDTATVSYTITQPNEIEISETVTGETCYGSNDASITINNINNATAPYTYLWSTGATTKNLTNIHFEEGEYEVYLYLTDAKGCKTEHYIYVDSYTKWPLNADLIISNASCNDNNGSVNIENVYNGTEPYSILWSNGDTSSTGIENLIAGSYFVQITDSNGCSNRKYFNVGNTDAPSIEINTIKPCKNMSNGEITLNISGGQSPYVCLWNDSTTGTSKSGVKAGQYSVIVSDINGCVSTECFIVENAEISLYSSYIPSGCNASNGKVIIGQYPSGNYTYKWENGSTNDTLMNVAAGLYKCTVTNENGCPKEITTLIQDSTTSNYSTVWELQKKAHCGQKDGQIAISPLRKTVTWYDKSKTIIDNDSILNNVDPGTYYFQITDANGCKTISNENVPVYSTQTQPICMVTIDRATNRNIVVWDNVQTTGIDHYNVYREACNGQFIKIGDVNSSNMSVFIDSDGIPNIKGYSYKISAIDNCGFESMKSDLHKTINLRIEVDESNHTAALKWDNYIGFPTSEFKIYKNDTYHGWEVINTVSKNIHSFIDENYDWRALGYCIAVEKPDGPCYASNRATGGPYYQSVSNLEDEGIANTSNIETISQEEVKIYPIPVKELLNIQANSNINNVKIYNLSGQLIVEYNKLSSRQVSLPTKKLDSGIYFIEIETNTLIRQKFIVE